MKNSNKIVFIVNHDVVIYNFRKELVEKLLSLGHEVFIISPDGKKINLLIEMGCKHEKIDVNRHGINPVEDIKLFNRYSNALKKIGPDIVFTYTIKPNIYGGAAAYFLHIPFFINVTGLGNAIKNDSGFLKKISSYMYSQILKRADAVFFQNKNDMSFFSKKISFKRVELLPGSGVNLSSFQPIEYPKNKKLRFLFLSRIMKEKGFDEFLSAARQMKSSGYDASFEVAGFIDEIDYEKKVNKSVEEGIINYYGQVDDVRQLFKNINCLVLPSYHEGMSNVLLEAAASGRPLIASNIPGCQEIIDDRNNGFLCEPKNSEDLLRKMILFYELSWNEQEFMGIKSRDKVEKEFNRNIITDKYIDMMEDVLK